MYQGPSTGSVLQHLRRIHPKRCPELLTNSLKSTLPTQILKINDNQLKNMRPDFDVDVFTKHLITWMIKTDQPFSIINDSEFTSLLDYMMPKLDLHIQKTFAHSLVEMFEQRTDLLKQQLTSVESKYSITCNVWTSTDLDAFIGITIHYIDNTWYN